MQLDATIMTRLVMISKITTIVLATLGSAGAVAGLIWALVMIVRLCVEGLTLLVSSCQQLAGIVGGTPVLHFLFLLGLICLVVCISARLARFTVDYTRAQIAAIKGVPHVI